MNRTYSIVWSAVRSMYVVASELARGHSKVKIQAHANEVTLSIEKPESGWTIITKHNALAFAIVAALGLTSSLAMADNPVSYIDGADHDLNAETSPISYSGTGQGVALYLEGLATDTGGWQATLGTGTDVVIETDGGGDILPDGSHAIGTAIMLDKGAMLNLTDAQISTTGIYTVGIDLKEKSSMTLTRGSILVGGNYGALTLYGESKATLIGTEIKATTENSSDIVSQEGSTLTIKDDSIITLTDGQVRVIGDTTLNSFLNVTESTVSSTGTDSTVIASNKGVLDITNSTVTHDNAKGAAIEASSASTLNVFGDDKSQMSVNSKGIGIKILASSVDIDGATINADGDGIFITSKGKSSWYDDTNALTVNNADVTSKTAAALHVDSKTNINDPIELNNSTLTGPTAIKLDSAVTVKATNSTTLDGNVDAGITASSLSLTNSSLQGSVNGLNSSLTLDNTSQWNMTDPSIVGNLTNDGGITLSNASGSTGTLLTVDNTLTLQGGSQINATLDTANSSPIIKAANVTLDGTLNLSSTATFVAPETDEHFGSVTLIDSQTAITTDFDSVTLDADTSAMPDYLTINAGVDANDNTNYELSTGLSWYAGANSARAAHGTFTVDADSTFTVTSELDETTATSDWDGSKLTKQGDGTLILSNTGNDYGDTEIVGGILAAKDAASLGTGDVTIAENATLALSQGTLDNNVTGEGQIVKSGSDELIVTGDNNYSGGTTISGGTLTVDHADSLGSGDIDNSGVLKVGEGELENTLSGSGSLVKTGSGELTLSGDNDYSGGTIISDGTLIADNADSLGTGAVANSGVLQVGEGELENTLSGSGSLVKTGSGELTLSGDNDYSGGTIISDGTLIADNADSLGTGAVANSGVLQVGEGELENTLSGSGSLVKTGSGELTLSGDNDYSGGTIISDGTLIADNADSLGTGAVANSGVLQVGEGELENTLSGSGSLVKTGSGELTLSGDNDYSGGTIISDGTLIADNADSLGTGAVANSGVLQVGEGELENTLSGSGSLVKTGTGELTLSGDNSYSGGTTITDGMLTADHADSLGTGAVANSGVLQVGEGELENTLSGSGSLVKTGTGELTLSGDNSYSGTTTITDGTLIAANVNALGGGNIDNSGTLMLDANGAFELANVTTHTGATTALAAGSTLDAGQLTQENGSTLSIDLGAATDDAVITADSVTLGGTLNVTGIGSVTDSWTPEAYTYTLIDSDSAITSDFDDLTIAGMNREDVDFLTIDGKIDEADNTNYDLTASLSWYADRDNATTDAHGTFTLSDPDGSFNVAATLTDVDDTLDPGSRWDGKSLTKEGAGTLILSGDNDYSGGTTINEGTLVAASTTALGTGLVDNNATLVLDADGEVSAVGGITTHSGATTQLALGTSLDLGDSALIQQDGSTLNVELNSDSVQPLITGGSATLGGDLVVSDASLQARASDAEFQSFKLMDMDSDISGDFTSLTMNLTDQPDYLTVTGTINPEDASEYLLTEGLSWNATATSATPAHGTFTLGAGDSFEVTSVLGDKTGNGDWDGKTLTKLGAGKLTLSGVNTYTGDTNVQEGTLWLAGDGTIGEVGSQQAVNVASGATFGGSNGTTVNGKVTNEGTLVFGDSEETGAIFTLNGDLVNMGTIASGSTSSTPGNTLYVDGNYTGNGGSLYLNTVLGDDDSATDKLVITGDASGTTDLYINGIGDGAQTTNGIEVVDVGGVSTSDAFELKNEVNASLYTYRLYWNESDNDWYLASKAQSDDDDSGGDDTPSDGGDDGGNVTPPDDGGDGGDVTPPDDGGDVAPQYRADIGAYMGNQWMARNLQMQTLYDREGSQYRNADGSVWARFKAGKAESEAVSGNIDMDSNYSQFQLGGDILAWGNGQQSVTVGVMASYINADTDSTGNRGADGSQFTSSGNVDGYNLGVYATWFADAQTHSGAYVDSWYQYGFYNNSVESGDAGSESYDSTANAVSLETGYRYDIALSNGNTVSLTPQAQVVWQNYSADSVKDNYGTRIDGQDGDSWTTRLGLRVDGKLYKGSRTVIQPFAEANWLHTSDDVSVSFDDATVKQDLPANRAELKVGLQADIDKQWSVRAQVAGQTGSNDFGDLNGSLNLRYNW
ncbi:AIDA autotransporter [Salmonella enterica subsp. enterica serovar Weltevreden]|uniref:fibronectin-binding autotransporter adhesin ShdA n=1 Tax=Salmonella enterica TaxID=28901 RepID=UPI000D030E25|nr:fibronectin-binding autotransporter adhesin ShdA [Salmonella enterica]PRU43557.1 AIDA autotransporter [Salmonella enterica subsp. enterica serovar Weltevreden]PRU75586.1 AIDA autotransporter [Salmonella enterica subsp. enterica serovar Weltevreden]PRU97250.1 AIDA autotransporter [Salmonella enterica subsp. enterica serovar Weltevreden]PRV68457.1 AIDA autotransporter [Salmonella enterica subsp. enterica serovar Weltevreden]PRV88208.1 AIDA autotransporter [Salmonella enterica subsp. enterica 